jgi:hypothetical protein
LSLTAKVPRVLQAEKPVEDAAVINLL